MEMFAIAGVRLAVSHSGALALGKFAPFRYSGGESAGIALAVAGRVRIPRPRGKLVLDERLRWVRPEAAAGGCSVYIPREDPDDIAYLLNTDRTWQRAEVLYRKDGFNAECAVGGPLGEVLFRNRLLFHGGFVLHASAVAFAGKCLLFSAPSETGKSTQARLWREEMGAALINNDRPAFLPYHDEGLMDLAVRNLESLLKNKPVYLLRCRPDMGAVKLVHETIWGNGG